MRKVNKNYEENTYTKVALQDLILFGVYSVLEKGEICTFERLVAECFNNFPKVFGFKRFPQWPDSLRFDRPIRTLRERGLITGGVRTYFRLTEAGLKKALRVEQALNTRVCRKKRKPTGNRSIDDRIVAHLKSSRLFNSFLKNAGSVSISEWEFRELLRCTMESPTKVVKENLDYYKDVAKKYDEEQLLKFLCWCEQKFIGEKEDD